MNSYNARATLATLTGLVFTLLLLPATSLAQTVTLEEVETGGSENSTTVRTGSGLTKVASHLYLAAISTKPYQPVIAVSGMGLDWVRMDAQCAGRNQTGIEVWSAQGQSGNNQRVTATLSNAPASAVIAVSRYANVDVQEPTGTVVSRNTNGRNGRCSGGQDRKSYVVDLITTAPGSTVYGAATMRNRNHTAGPGYTEQAEISRGSGGNIASLAVQDRLVTSQSTVGVKGTFSGKVDWAMIGIEIKPEGSQAPGPNLVVESTSHDFGPVQTNSSRSHGFEISNDGTADLRVLATTVSGSNSADFSIDSGDAPFTVSAGERQNISVSFNPVVEGTSNARLEIVSNDTDQPFVNVALTGTSAMTVAGGLWISAAELALKPMSGDAWNRLKAAADGDLGFADVSDLTSQHDVKTLAVALVYARTNNAIYRQKARDSIMSAIGTEDDTEQVVALGRNIAPYIIAADLIGLGDFYPAGDAQFRDWIDQVRYIVWQDGSLIDEDDERVNNHGRMCGATRAAIAVYLGEQTELERTAQVFKGFLGDRGTYNNFEWKHNLSWQADEANPVGINPAGATKDGINIDGALPEEMRRACGFRPIPCYTNYPWEGLQGALVEAVILSRAGYDVFNWEDQAILRAVQYLKTLDEQNTRNWWAQGDDTWQPWLINAYYGTSYPTERARIGKLMGWTDWTHAP